MNHENDPITKLIRLKRYERPPEGYAEDFLLEFQRRQRLRSMQPTLRDRVEQVFSSLFNDFRIPAYAYGTVGLMAVALSAWILSSEKVGNSQTAMAAPQSQELRFDISSPLPDALSAPVNIPAQRLVGSLPPHYVLQSRPSAENEPYSF